MKTVTFEDLNVWKEAHGFVLDIYQITKKFPKEEIFGLVSQFRRASVSIPSNTAEGYRKKGINDKLRFYNIAISSADECKYYIILSRDLNYFSEEVFNALYEKINLISKMLNSYCAGILKNQNKENL